MENPKPSPTDEIDIAQLFRKLGDGLKNMRMSFIRFIALLRRVPIENKYSFLGIVGVSVALATVYTVMLKKSYYESTMILSSVYFNKKLVDNAINKLDALARESNKAGLARVFNIPDSLAENIIGFEATPFISETEMVEYELLAEQLRNLKAEGIVVDEVLKRIEIENRHFFEITIRTLKASVIPNLQDSFVDYFRNNEYIKRRIEITRSLLLDRKEKLLSEMKKMDSLKVLINANYKSMAQQKSAGSNNVILGERVITDPVEVFAQDLAIYNEIEKINRELALQTDFEVVDGFTEFSEPASPSLAKMILLSLSFGIVMAYLDVAVRAANKYLATVK